MDCQNKPIRCEFCGANTWILEGINQCECPENNPEDDQNEEELNPSTKKLPGGLTKNEIAPKL